MIVLYCSYGMYSGCTISPKSSSRPRIYYASEFLALQNCKKGAHYIREYTVYDFNTLVLGKA